ncbi:MAG: serpin family protein [candidate division Zixibacteria bacterium]|nr:serpin family protein [candidate division Zixibacteria bacterium]
MTATERRLVTATNEFTFDLFEKIAAVTPADSNLFISPMSAAYALAMAYNGAAGDTRDSISATLKIGDLTTNQVNESFAGLTDVLTNADQTVTITIANAVWHSTRLTLVPEFADIVRTFFGARVSGLDFTDPSSVDTINSWVSENTNGKIKKVFESPLDPSWVYILANAVYFKADWTVPFDTRLTRADTFHLADGSAMSADFMWLDSWTRRDDSGRFDPDVTYLVKDNEFTAFSLPYGDRWFRMTVFLPDTSLPVTQFISQFTVEKWDQWRSEFLSGRFKAKLPRFKFGYEVALDDILASMGMNIAFQSGAADFSNMFEGGGVWIDTVIHKTFVQVDEKGTEAAAVTVIGGPTSLPPFIDCNRPFVFVISEKESGAVMFVGKVARPVWEE